MPWICPVVQWSVHWALNRTTLVLVLAGKRSGREIVPNTGANVTKFFTLATKSRKLAAKLTPRMLHHNLIWRYSELKRFAKINPQ